MTSKIFIDCGANDGCSVRKFMDQRSGYEIYSFEPNPALAHHFAGLPTSLIPKAVWTEDTSMEMFFDPIDADGSTLIEEKETVFELKGANTLCPKAEVQCIDLGRWIRETFEPDQYIVLKLDVEGAEYQILRKMLTDGTFTYLNELLIEFHWDKMGLPESEHIALVERIREFLEPVYWDASDYRLSLTRAQRIRQKLQRKLFNLRVKVLEGRH